VCLGGGPSGFTDDPRGRVSDRSLARPTRALGDGFRVEIHVIVWQGDAVLRLPSTALFRSADRWAVLAIDGGRLRERRLVIGEQSPELAEVRGGASEGELIVLHPGEELHEGVRAEPREPPP